ncbi:hypothetical protein FRB96_009649 [Tulasnella sp. 330]|nr:hypothetical protein FRB96_009649 [Tulasnella sp. 330]
MLQESPLADPPTSRISRMHSSLNSNIERLYDIRKLTDVSDEARPSLKVGEAELVRTLQGLILTSTPLKNEDRALRAGTVREKEKPLQSILYMLLLKTEGESNPLEVSKDMHANPEKRREAARNGHVAGLLLTSSLRLFLRLHPIITSEQAWAAFDKYIRRMAFGDLVPGDLVTPVSLHWIEVWDAVIQMARGGPTSRISSHGFLHTLADFKGG